MAMPAGFKIRHWTKDEVAQLKRLKASNCSGAKIAATIGRSLKAIEQKWFWVREYE